MRMLVRRYITAEQRKRDDFGITEDDVMEIRQDISSLRFELIDILNTNGMKTPHVNPNNFSCKLKCLEFRLYWWTKCNFLLLVSGKKGKMLERRILKDFQIGIVESIVTEAVQKTTETKDIFTSIAQAMNIRASAKKFVWILFIEPNFSDDKLLIFRKQDWNALVRQTTITRDPIGSTRNSLTRRDRRSLRRHILEEVGQGLKMNTQRIVGMCE